MKIGNRITLTIKWEPRWPCFAFGFVGGHKEIILLVWAVAISLRIGY